MRCRFDSDKIGFLFFLSSMDGTKSLKVFNWKRDYTKGRKVHKAGT